MWRWLPGAAQKYFGQQQPHHWVWGTPRGALARERREGSEALRRIHSAPLHCLVHSTAGRTGHTRSTSHTGTQGHQTSRSQLPPGHPAHGGGHNPLAATGEWALEGPLTSTQRTKVEASRTTQPSALARVSGEAVYIRSSELCESLLEAGFVYKKMLGCYRHGRCHGGRSL